MNDIIAYNRKVSIGKSKIFNNKLFKKNEPFFYLTDHLRRSEFSNSLRPIHSQPILVSIDLLIGSFDSDVYK